MFHKQQGHTVCHFWLPELENTVTTLDNLFNRATDGIFFIQMFKSLWASWKYSGQTGACSFIFNGRESGVNLNIQVPARKRINEFPKMFSQSYSLKVRLHPFVISCGSFWQHSTWSESVCHVHFPAVLLVKPQADGAGMSNDDNSGMRRSVNPCWCYCV